MERERGLVLRRDGATRSIDAMTSHLDLACCSQRLCLRDAPTSVFHVLWLAALGVIAKLQDALLQRRNTLHGHDL